MMARLSVYAGIAAAFFGLLYLYNNALQDLATERANVKTVADVAAQWEGVAKQKQEDHQAALESLRSLEQTRARLSKKARDFEQQLKDKAANDADCDKWLNSVHPQCAADGMRPHAGDNETPKGGVPGSDKTAHRPGAGVTLSGQNKRGFISVLQGRGTASA